jgi:hypothetical protein
MAEAPFGVGLGVSALDLPPGFTEVALREAGDAFAQALAIADEAGAGTLVWVRRFDLAEFAVVLEPEEPLAGARRAIYLGLAAMADALAFHAPPEKALVFAWPDTIKFDGAILGGGRIGWSAGAAETAPPDRLVFGGMIRMAALSDSAGGTFRLGTSLEVEGFADVTAGQLIESFARHLMAHVDAWGERGFKAVAEPWLARLEADGEARRGLDVNGDLLLHRPGARTPERRPLLPRLAEPAWLDPATGEPKL